ncbi:MAG TPA: protein kinase [Gemmatimonadaceae bacterium]|nr:protein kinase [Gemmatimonadaceae bacterium]
MDTAGQTAVADVRALEADFEVLRELGRGTMGVVVLARRREGGRLVAIKVVHPRSGDSADAEARLEREARTVGRMQHPNIVRHYEMRRLDGGGVALVMEYVAGETLATTLRRTPRLSSAIAGNVLRDIAQALQYAHEQHVVHRDVKPANIFIYPDTGTALLSDFGIAKSLEGDADITLAGFAIGTPTYMSPEQLDGDPVDCRSDLYSLGVVGWEMLSGIRPWLGEGLYGVIYKQKYQDLPRIAAIRSDVPPRIVHALDGALDKDPTLRFASATEFLEQLGQDEPTAATRRRHAARGTDPAIAVSHAEAEPNVTMQFRPTVAPSATPEANFLPVKATPAAAAAYATPAEPARATPARAPAAPAEPPSRREAAASTTPPVAPVAPVAAPAGRAEPAATAASSDATGLDRLRGVATIKPPPPKPRWTRRTAVFAVAAIALLAASGLGARAAARHDREIARRGQPARHDTTATTPRVVAAASDSTASVAVATGPAAPSVPNATAAAPDPTPVAEHRAAGHRTADARPAVVTQAPAVRSDSPRVPTISLASIPPVSLATPPAVAQAVANPAPAEATPAGRGPARPVVVDAGAVALRNAERLLAARDFRHARVAADAAIGASPRVPGAYAVRARVRLQQGQIREAWADAEMAARLGDYWAAQTATAIVEQWAGDTTAARNRVNALVRLASDGRRTLDPREQIQLAMALTAVGDHGRAIAALEHVSRADATLPVALADPTFDPLRGEARFRALVERAGSARIAATARGRS